MFFVSQHKHDISLAALPASRAWQAILQKLTSSGNSCLLERREATAPSEKY